MKSKRAATRRNKTTAASSLTPRLGAYSATAAAALAFAPNAQAQTIPITSFSYSGHTNITTPPSFALPYPRSTLRFSAGPFALAFAGVQVYHNSSGGGGMVSIYGRNGLFIADNGGIALKLGPGSAIKLQPGFNFAAELALNNPNNIYGNFLPPANGAVTGYIGFKGSHAGHSYYGWLNVKVTGDANGYPIAVALVPKTGAPGVFGAYDISTDPNINSFGTNSIPEPADAAFGLGLLAFGAAGVRELRRRRKQAA
ncbi:MAG TPA: hypothetical protein VHC95_09210 [Opitutales bacterium]|nr:hypothetical protein [Opitutales bacterium]